MYVPTAGAPVTVITAPLALRLFAAPVSTVRSLAAGAATSYDNALPEASDALAARSVPALPSPGGGAPPRWTVTAPAIGPLPPIVPPLFTVTAPVPVAEPLVFDARSVPPLTVVPPLYVLAPRSV